MTSSDIKNVSSQHYTLQKRFAFIWIIIVFDDKGIVRMDCQRNAEPEVFRWIFDIVPYQDVWLSSARITVQSHSDREHKLQRQRIRDLYLRVRFETKNPGIYDALGDRLGSETFEAIWLSIGGRRCRRENYALRLTALTGMPGKTLNLPKCLSAIFTSNFILYSTMYEEVWIITQPVA